MEFYGIGKNVWIEKGGYNAGTGYRIMNRVFEKGRIPEAVFVFDDRTAMGVMRSIKENAFRIPEDIAVAGFDNIDCSNYCDPQLTTIEQPVSQMGEVAANLLLKIINNKDLKPDVMNILIPPKLIIRKFS